MERDTVKVTGIILSVAPVGEYDRRLVLLSAELGRITVFARGARKQQSQWQAASRPFAMGTFFLYPGRNAYTLRGTEISSYFEELSRDIEAVSYGFYFLELAGYYSRENMESGQLLNLLYVTLKALLKPAIPNDLIRLVFEIRTMTIGGEFPDVSRCGACGAWLDQEAVFVPGRERLFCRECGALEKGGYPLSAAAVYALQHITGAPLTKLYTFTLKPSVLEEIRRPLEVFKGRHLDRTFQSLTVLESILP